MKIFVPIEKRTLLIPPETYLEIMETIKNNGKFKCKIDGTPYYLSKMQMIQDDLIEAEFVSDDPVEIEVTADECGKIG